MSHVACSRSPRPSGFVCFSRSPMAALCARKPTFNPQCPFSKKIASASGPGYGSSKRGSFNSPPTAIYDGSARQAHQRSTSQEETTQRAPQPSSKRPIFGQPQFKKAPLFAKNFAGGTPTSSPTPRGSAELGRHFPQGSRCATGSARDRSAWSLFGPRRQPASYERSRFFI